MSTQKILITENKALHPNIQQDTNNNALVSNEFLISEMKMNDWESVCLHRKQ